MKEIKEEYGNDAFYIQYGTGVLGGTVSKSWHPDQTMFARLMNLWGATCASTPTTPPDRSPGRCRS